MYIVLVCLRGRILRYGSREGTSKKVGAAELAEVDEKSVQASLGKVLRTWPTKLWLKILKWIKISSIKLWIIDVRKC